MKKSTMTILIIVLLAIGGGAYLLVSGSDDDNAVNNSDESANSTTQSENTEPVDSAATEPAVVAATITYTGSGFSPAAVTVKAGDSIKVVNNSTMLLSLRSDPHPVHTDNEELNAGEITTGSSKTFTVKNIGTWGFHNHENDSHKGKITIQ